MARPGLRIHPKFKRLVHILRIPAPYAYGCLEFIWAAAYECGNPLIGDAVAVELVAEWAGEPGALCSALAATGFLDEIHGQYQVHDLFDHAPDYVRRRMDREAKRQATGQTLSDVRRQAALARWGSDASGCKQKSLAECQDAKVSTPARAPARLEEGVPSSRGLAAKEDDEKPHTTRPQPSRKRDPLWDALVEVSGSDPKTSARFLGSTCRSLRAADPPYTAADVLALPAILAAKGFSLPLTLGTVEKYIGWTRQPQTPGGTDGGRSGKTVGSNPTRIATSVDKSAALAAKTVRIGGTAAAAETGADSPTAHRPDSGRD